jgi:hypothetical protein
MNEIDTFEDKNVRRLVLSVRKLMLKSRLLRGLVVWLTISLGMWLLLILADNLLHLPDGLRLAGSLGGLAVMGFELWQLLLMPIIRQDKLESVTLFLESKFSIPENMLINSLCFESAQLTPRQEPFAAETIKTGSAMIANAKVSELWQMGKMKRWLIALLIILVLWMLYGVTQGRELATALLRYASPLGDVPPAGSVVLEVTPSDDVVLAEGDDLKIGVRVRGLKRGESLLQYPEVVWKEAADFVSNERNANKSTPMQLSSDAANSYSHTFKSVGESFAFRVFAADTYSRSIKVTVNRLPRIKESQFHILAPSYTGRQRINTLGPPEALAGPAGSDVSVDVKLDKSAEELWYKSSGPPVRFEKNNDLWTAKIKLEQTGSYQIEVKAKGFERRIKIADGAVLAQQDRPPEVEFVTSDLNRQVSPSDRLRLDIQAYDDFGAKRIYVTQKSARAGGAATTLKSWDYKGPPGKAQSRETLLLSIDAGVFKPGDTYILQAYCEDFSPAGNVGVSKPLTLQVKSLDEMTIAPDDPNRDAFAELEEAIKAQQTALGVTRNVTANLDDVVSNAHSGAQNHDALGRHLSQMEKKQKLVGAHITRAWDVSPEPKPQFVTRLVELRDNEHKHIMEKMKETGRIEQVDSNSASFALASIARQQQFLLDQLIALKGLAAKKDQAEEQKAMAKLLGQKDESLSPTPEKTLENTVKELDNFINQQKDIMQKRQMILDKPPEDMSRDDQDKLEELAIDQSKLAEVLANVVNDLSNMNLLDSGDDQMVQSMKSIYQKAQDLADKAEEAAEKRQARQDAYRLETEAVEMAKELEINCEATLGYYDNIQFVAETPEDKQLDAPLPELPSELDDLVGDLVTSEEEMRPEVEDIGSYLNSLDHTAGPVSDGTISSTSAKGKTGDQKPEDNVLQGRSGAGRSGMSDGQLVEPVAKDLPDNDYALRERVSNTPLESGQVKDEDVGAATGGTGLGKTTDSTTQFGVGGKLPPKVLDMMREALQTQQTIRQASQNAVTQLKRHNLSVTDLDASIQAMKKVEASIKRADGLAIRAAYDQTLGALKKSHSAVGSQLAIQYTRDQALAKRLKNMLARKQTQDFKGYNQMVSAYFEALAQSSGQNKTTGEK